MDWRECFQNKIITKILPDKERGLKLLEMSELRLKFWNLSKNDKFISLKIEAYYEIIKELIFAHLYYNGYNCSNHICLIAYIKKMIDDFDYEAAKIDELRKIRNEINYRGFQIKKDYIERNEFEFHNIIERIKSEIFKHNIKNE